MAFVTTPSALAGSSASAFAGARATSTKPAAAPRVHAARVRMADPPAQSESPEVGVAGDSMWKETLLAGGFPGGEAFLNKWVEDGMTKEVPDMPSRMQPTAGFDEKPEEKGGVLGKLDNTEFFKKFVGSESDPANAPPAPVANAAVVADTAVAVAPAAAAAPAAPADPDAPDPALYEQYFPSATRNLAPEIDVRRGENGMGRVSVAMTEVTARASDLYFPKSEQYVGPVISMRYNGSNSNSWVKLEMKEIEGLPTLPPPAQPGQAVTKLVPGNGGGLKLTYEIQGQGEVKL